MILFFIVATNYQNFVFKWLLKRKKNEMMKKIIQNKRRKTESLKLHNAI